MNSAATYSNGQMWNERTWSDGNGSYCCQTMSISYLKTVMFDAVAEEEEVVVHFVSVAASCLMVAVHSYVDAEVSSFGLMHTEAIDAVVSAVVVVLPSD